MFARFLPVFLLMIIKISSVIPLPDTSSSHEERTTDTSGTVEERLVKSHLESKNTPPYLTGLPKLQHNSPRKVIHEKNNHQSILSLGIERNDTYGEVEPRQFYYQHRYHTHFHYHHYHQPINGSVFYNRNKYENRYSSHTQNAIPRKDHRLHNNKKTFDEIPREADVQYGRVPKKSTSYPPKRKLHNNENTFKDIPKREFIPFGRVPKKSTSYPPKHQLDSNEKTSDEITRESDSRPYDDAPKHVRSHPPKHQLDSNENTFKDIPKREFIPFGRDPKKFTNHLPKHKLDSNEKTSDEITRESDSIRDDDAPKHIRNIPPNDQLDSNERAFDEMTKDAYIIPDEDRPYYRHPPRDDDRSG